MAIRKDTPHASASRLEDFSTFINVGAIELFVNDGINYAQNLLNAGVPTELHVYPGVYHGASGIVPNAQISKDMEEDRF